MPLIAIAVLTLFGFGCGGANVPAELVGKWTSSGAVGGPDEPGPSWMKEYTLRSDGSFEMSGYPPIIVKGRWKVPERDGDRFRIVLTDQRMQSSPRERPNEWRDEDSWAVLSGGKLEWQGSMYSRSE